MSSDPKVNILLVDDHPENLLALEAILSSLGENLIKANSGEEALRSLLHDDFAVILLDVQMPGMNGFETADLIRKRLRSRQIPIIFLTAFSTNDDLMFKGYSLGAVDYLHKPIDPVILKSKVSVFVDLFRKTEIIKRQTKEVERQATQLKTINAELKQSEERFRLLSVCSPVGIFLFDITGQCTYINPRCQEICGFTFEEGLGDGWLRFLHPDDKSKAISDWKQYIDEKQELSQEYRFQTLDGATCWTHLRTSPMFSDLGELIGHVGTVEDITARKQTEIVREQMLREQIARREAEAASRMKDEFLAVLSHELRTPLNAILGWSRLLRTRNFDEATTQRALETIERNANAQAQLVEDILDVSKIIRGKLRLNWLPVNLVSIIEAAIDSVRPQAEAKSIQLEFTASLLESQVFGDPVRLQQVIWNLLTNAIKFTPEEGCVEIRLEEKLEEKTEDKLDDDKMLNLAANCNLGNSAFSPTRGYVQIQVTDTGIGISPDFLQNVFDRFRQADSTTTRAHNGLGLGLAIVRHLVELHKGQVEAESLGEGQGSTFTVKLPLQQESPPTVITQSNEATSIFQVSNLEGVKLLLVEDAADARDFLSFVLQQYGAEVAVTASVREALLTLAEFQPNVLISDIAMPEQDGYALIRQIRKLEKSNGTFLPAIALTAYSSPEDHKKSIAMGFNAHLPKPVKVHDLVNTIVQLLTVRSCTPSDSSNQTHKQPS